MKKIIGFFLFVSITSVMYSEMLFNANMGWLLYTEKYDELADYRYVHGPHFNFNFAFYPRNSFIGFFADSSALNIINREKRIISEFSSAIGPSFMWRINPYIGAAFSVGPFYSVSLENYREEKPNPKPDGLVNTVTETSITETFGLGLQGDLSFMFRAGKRLYFKTGLIGKWTLLRNTLLTMTSTGTSEDTDVSWDMKIVDGYHGFGLVPYIGLGLGYLRN